MPRPPDQSKAQRRPDAWIGQEVYTNRKTGARKLQKTWSVKYYRDGKQQWERGFETRDDANLWWLEQKKHPERHVAQVEVIKPKPIELNEWLEYWLKTSRSSWSAGAHRVYESHVREHLKPSLGRELLVNLEEYPERIEAAMESLERKDGRVGPLSAVARKKIFCTLQTALNKAVKLRKIKVNPCDLLDAPKVERKEMLALSAAQVKLYLLAFDQTAIGAAVAVALGSGCRIGELLGLRWRDFDAKRGTIRVERSLERVKIETKNGSRYEVRPKEPKSKYSRRTIPLTGYALARLKRYRLEQAERFISAGARPNDDTLVFDCDGQPWVPTSFGMHYARLRNEARLPRARFHDLRHTYGSLLLQSGTDLKTVSRALGHSSVAITADLYIHFVPAMLESAAVRLDDFIEAA
jgi:integrase